MNPLLSVQGLSTGFHSADGFIPATHDVSFDLLEGQSVALVGESGSGKSVTALSILRLLAMPPAEIRARAITYRGREIHNLSARAMRGLRGRDIAMIFQEPMSSLNPLMTVGYQIAEVMMHHNGYRKPKAMAAAVDMLKRVGIPDAENRARQYPHQMSGGMRQRAMIAIALAADPGLLIADEPTTALDVTIQAQILALIADMQKERGMAMLLITHNLGIVAEVVEKVMVMYAGQIVEYCPVETVFAAPRHPYTRGLLKSLPSVEEKKRELYVIEGTVPSPMFFPEGCRFHPRCPYARQQCRDAAPELSEIEQDHGVRCFFPLEREEAAQHG